MNALIVAGDNSKKVMGKINNPRNKGLFDHQLFFDFDNTITSIDILDDLIERYSIDGGWRQLEKAWKDGKIGSGECLKGQLGKVRISKEELVKYLYKIKIDPYFKKLLKLMAQFKIKPIILSDDFGFIIRSVLKRHGLKGIKVYSNTLRFSKGRFITIFPYSNKKCQDCAHCKKNSLIRNSLKDKITVYIGDGFSDICPAKSAKLVFAKANLSRHFRELSKPYYKINSLKDVYDYFKRITNDTEAKVGKERK